MKMSPVFIPVPIPSKIRLQALKTNSPEEASLFLGPIEKFFIYRIGQNFPSLFVVIPQAIPSDISLSYSPDTPKLI